MLKFIHIKRGVFKVKYAQLKVTLRYKLLDKASKFPDSFYTMHGTLNL